MYNKIKNWDVRDYQILDPQGKKTINVDDISSIIVFRFSGGTYDEYNSLKRLEKKLGLKIYYGTDEMINAENYLNQLGKYYRW